MIDGEKALREMLKVTGVPVKASYNTTEVCKLLNVSQTTARRMFKEFELIQGKPKPGTLNSYLARGSFRVRFGELARYLRDNDTHEIECNQ
jgi:hypothetical protein